MTAEGVRQYRDLGDFRRRTVGILHVEPGEPQIWVLNKERVWAESVVDNMLATALFSDSDALRADFRALILQLGKEMGNPPGSVHAAYESRVGGGDQGLPVPAVAFPVLTYDAARAAFRAMRRTSQKSVVFKTSVPEMENVGQWLGEFSVSVIAASVKEQRTAEGWGPVYLQAELPTVQRQAYEDDPDGVVRRLTEQIDGAVNAGIYNLSVNAASLINYDRKTAQARQRLNGRVTAACFRYIRSVEPKQMRISVNASLGELSGIDPREDSRALLRRIEKESDGNDLPELTMISACPESTEVQSDETILDTATLRELAAYGREKLGIIGVLWHCPASLSAEQVPQLSEYGVVEYHPPLDLQEYILTHARLPQKLSVLIRDHSTASQPIPDASHPAEASWRRMPPQHLWKKKAPAKRAILDDVEQVLSALFESLQEAESE